MSKKKPKGKPLKMVTMEIPISIVSDVKEAIAEELARDERRHEPLKREKIISPADRTQVMAAHILVGKLKKPMKVVRQVQRRLDDVGSDDVPSDDARWLERLQEELYGLSQLIENLTS